MTEPIAFLPSPQPTRIGSSADPNRSTNKMPRATSLALRGASWVRRRLGFARPSEGIDLGRDATLSLRPGTFRSLSAVRGTVLITQSGDHRDHLLEPGDRFRPAPRGRVVAWALDEARLQLER
jgi:hypothetical protein